MNPFFPLDVPLYLASRSPRRQSLLRELDIPFQTIEVDVAETPRPGWGPAELAVRLAAAKAVAGAGGVAAGLVLGADTVVLIDGHVLGKPGTKDEARAMLGRLAGRSHEVLTGMALVMKPDGRMVTDCARTRVTMRRVDSDLLDAYIESGEPMDKAGAYGIQGYGGALVESIEGCFFNVVGLPLTLLATMIARFK